MATRLASHDPGREECRFVVKKTFRTRPNFLCDLTSANFEGFTLRRQSVNTAGRIQHMVLNIILGY